MTVGVEIDRLFHALSPGHDIGNTAPLERYCALVAEWDARTDLTGARDSAQLVEILFADAWILATSGFLPSNVRGVDVGSGAGAPILPLLLLRRDLRATLVEPRRKRVAFLRTVIGSLAELAGRATVIEGSLDLASPRIAGMPFDVAIARATFPPDEWLRAGLAIAKRVIVLTAAAELATPADLVVAQRVEYTLPRTKATRVAVAYETRR